MIMTVMAHTLIAQPDSSPTDTTLLFGFDDFYQIVQAYHPVVSQAQLLSQQAVQQLRSAKGAFDPKLEAQWKNKSYQGTEYYDLRDVYLKLPLRFPVRPKVGYEHHEGEYLNPENYISESSNRRQLAMGVSVDLGRGMFIDQSRATLRQAELMQEMAEAEQVKLINKMLLDAAKDYWNWYLAYTNYELLRQSIGLAQDIYDRTKLSFTYGEVAAVDTLQALILLQQRSTDLQQADIQRAQAGLSLSNHLWNEDGQPLRLPDGAQPDSLTMDQLSLEELESLLTRAQENHPELASLQLKQQSLEIDQGLARENLKPVLQLDYSLLNQPIGVDGESADVRVREDYKVSVNFVMPLFLRKERAKLAQTRLKLQDNLLDQRFTQREILNDIRGQYVGLTTTQDLLVQQQQMVDNYRRLVEAEQFNLENGESDLFKINAQLDKWIDAQSKLLKLQTDYQKNKATLYWYAGLPNLSF